MRITLIHIRSGQPRAYADSEHVVQLKFEQRPYVLDDEQKLVRSEEWLPWFVDRQKAVEAFRGFPLTGWTDTVIGNRKDPFQTYLDYVQAAGEVRHVDRTGKEYEDAGTEGTWSVSDLWEMRTVTPYDD